MTDFDLKTKAGNLSGEELKSLLDVIEGGSIPSTRYRACQLDGGLPRMIAVNTNGQGASPNYGSWFQKFGQYGLAALVDNLNDLPAATRLIRNMPDDEVASARRVGLWSLEANALITDGMHERLTADTTTLARDPGRLGTEQRQQSRSGSRSRAEQKRQQSRSRGRSGSRAEQKQQPYRGTCGESPPVLAESAVRDVVRMNPNPHLANHVDFNTYHSRGNRERGKRIERERERY
jgi:hypothetical protein